MQLRLERYEHALALRAPLWIIEERGVQRHAPEGRQEGDVIEDPRARKVVVHLDLAERARQRIVARRTLAYNVRLL